MKKAGERSLLAAIARGDYVELNGVIYGKIRVTVDGCWCKRSYKSSKYNSLSGAAAIIDYDTGEVLFMSVRNKYCAQCETNIRNNKEPNSDNHACQKNWGREQASTAMEASIILEVV